MSAERSRGTAEAVCESSTSSVFCERFVPPEDARELPFELVDVKFGAEVRGPIGNIMRRRSSFCFLLSEDIFGIRIFRNYISTGTHRLTGRSDFSLYIDSSARLIRCGMSSWRSQTAIPTAAETCTWKLPVGVLTL